MAWPHGLRRHETTGQRFISALVREFGCRRLARMAGVSDRTIRRWRDGVDWPSVEVLKRLVETLDFGPLASLPIYSPDMAIDGNTRVVGVGEYTIRAARGVAADYDFEEQCDECC